MELAAGRLLVGLQHQSVLCCGGGGEEEVVVWAYVAELAVTAFYIFFCSS